MCYNNSIKNLTEEILMSPEQTIIIANMCKDYQEGNTFKYPPEYIMQYKSCKSCSNWKVGKCERAYNILKAID